MKIQPLEFSPIPEFVKGRLRKDGKPDRRYTTRMYMLEETINEVIGISEAARVLGKVGGTATKAKLGKEHFKKISKLGVKARSEKN